MVNVSDKKITKRTAIAKARMFLGSAIINHFNNDELLTKKGPVFQNPLLINGVDIDINIVDTENIEVFCKVTITGKTGVEMEALTGASTTCLTIYDMCKAISQEMVIKEIKLVEKTGGKSDIKND